MTPGSRLQDLTAKYMQNPRRFFVPLANEYLLSGDLDGAIALCREHLPAQPGHMSGHIVLGRAYFEKGDRDAAHDVFLTSVSLDDENLIALRHLGDIAGGKGEIEEARAWYARVLDADPENAEIEALLRSLDPAPSVPPEFEAPDESGFLTLSPPGANAPLGGAGSLTSALADPTPPGLRAILGGTDDAVFDPDLVRPTDPMPPSAVRKLETFDLSTLGDDSSADMMGGAPGTEYVPAAEDGETADAFGMQGDSSTGFALEDLDALVDPPAAEEPLPSLPTPSSTAEFGNAPPSTSIRPTPADELMARPGFGALASFASWRTAQERETPTYQAAQPAPVSPAADAPEEDGDLFEEHRSSETAPTAPEFVTETMATLYLSQGYTQQALEVYRALLARAPGDAALVRKVADLESVLSHPAHDAALEDDADKALQFDDLGMEDSADGGTGSVLETIYEVSPPDGAVDPFGTPWTPASDVPMAAGDDWFASDADADPIDLHGTGAGEMFGLALEGFGAERNAGGGAEAFQGQPTAPAGVVLESVFGSAAVAVADEAAAGMMVLIAAQMVGRLPKEAPTLPVPEVLELPSAVAGDQARGASPAPLLSFDRFFSGSGSPPRPRIDTPVRQVVQHRDTPPPVSPSPSLSPTFGGVPVIPPPRSTPAPNWVGFDQFLTPSLPSAPPAPSVPTPTPSDATRAPLPAASGATSWMPPVLPAPIPPAATPAPASASAATPPSPQPVVRQPTQDTTEPEPPRAAPSEFHRWLEGLS